jgi:TolB-like protein/class 3 adenylate cyclase
MKQPVQRRLAAILAADVAGYSRLMGADEEDTHDRLRAHLRELVDPKVKEHHGRVVKNTGDGMLVEFPSVINAVRCAAEMQRGMADRNAETPEDKRITFRVGINLGDVIAEPDDIYGDGVNVAARLEALAEPGGICISRMVRDQIRDKLSYPFEDIGEQSVKNIARSVQVYALRPEAVAELPATSVSTAAPRGRIAPVAMATAAAMALVIAAVAYWVWPAPNSSQSPAAVGIASESTQSAPSVTEPAVAPRLSIVVLPFANLSDDPGQRYFADGITEDVTTDLLRLENMLVISRNTAFTYRNKQIDAKQIGRELGVRFVLEGSVRRSGNQVRVNAQLIDAETNTHLWAERYDHDMGDLFALQNEITSRISLALRVELVGAEAARPTEHPDALDYILRGRASFFGKRPAGDVYEERINMFERALALDPRSVDAQSWLASALAGRVLDQLSDSPAVDIARAEGLIEQALAASPRSYVAHFAKGQLLRAQGRCEEAIPEYETAIAFNPRVGIIAALGECKFYTGAIEEMVPLQERAIRLSPRDPFIGNWYQRIGVVYLLQSRTKEAILWLERARSANPGRALPHAYLASAYALTGETERAGWELAEARRLSADGRYSSVSRLKATGYFGVPKIRALYEATYFAGLLKAGMPEE